jgi:hypothetical protein
MPYVNALAFRPGHPLSARVNHRRHPFLGAARTQKRCLGALLGVQIIPSDVEHVLCTL